MSNSSISLFFLIIVSINHSLAQDLIWAKHLGSAGWENSHALASDNQSNLFAIVNFTGIIDVDPGPDSLIFNPKGTRDISIIKLNSSGDLVWAKQFGGKFSDQAFALAIDAHRDVYVTGYFRDTTDFDPGKKSQLLYGNKSPDAFLIKLDTHGNLIWATQVTQHADSTGLITTYCLKLDAENNIYLLGKFVGATDFDPSLKSLILKSKGADDIFISKYDPKGKLIWVKQFGGQSEDEPYAMTMDREGNIYCTGSFTHQSDFDPGNSTYFLTAQDTTTDIFILKLNNEGEFRWAKQISGRRYDIGYSICVDEQGNSYTAGTYENQVDINPGPDSLIFLSENRSNGFVLSLNKEGDFRWARRITGPDGMIPYAISSLPGNNGGVYIAGEFSGELHVDNQPEIAKLNTDGKLIDLVVAKIDFNGQFKLLTNPGKGSPETIEVLSNKTEQVIFVGGEFSGHTEFDPNMPEFNFTSAGRLDVFILKISDPSKANH